MHYQGGFHRESLYALNNNGLAALNTDTLHFPLADEKYKLKRHCDNVLAPHHH